MPERPRILYVLESMIGFRIREQELSIPLQERVVQLMRVEKRMEHLKEEIEALNRKRRALVWFVVASGVAAGVGIIVGGLFLLRINPPLLQAGLSIWAGIGVFVVDFYILRFNWRLQWIVHENEEEIARLAVTYDQGLESLSHQLLQEPPATRLPLD
jgi:hypothetical protein